MSMELLVAVPAGAAISGVAIVGQAQRLGFSLTLSDTELFERGQGFLPGELAGVSTGAEIDLRPLEDDPESAELLGEAAEGKDRLYSFYWGGDYREGAFATVLAAALAASTGGVCLDLEEGEFATPERLVEIAGQFLAELDKAS